MSLQELTRSVDECFTSSYHSSTPETKQVNSFWLILTNTKRRDNLVFFCAVKIAAEGKIVAQGEVGNVL